MKDINKYKYVIRWIHDTIYISKFEKSLYRSQWSNINKAKTFSTREEAIDYITVDENLHSNLAYLSIDQIHPLNLL